MSETRVRAVLQRIALAYLFSAIIIRYAPKTVISVSVFLLLLYWVLLFFFGDAGAQYTIEGNAVHKLDLLVFGAKRM